MWRRRDWFACGLLLTVALCFRLFVAISLPNDTPEDGRVYAQIARNLLEQHTYTQVAKPPYQPTLVRLPGYPLFLAAIYSVFGHDNNTAVRIIQAFLDTVTCGLIGLLAFYWQPDEQRKRASAITALTLATICPFTAIYVGTILTETWASLLLVVLCLLVTRGSTASTLRRSLSWWFAAGVAAGIAVMFRPDSGLFALAAGLTLGVSLFQRQRGPVKEAMGQLHSRASLRLVQGVVFSIAFALALVPWTLRNSLNLHVFQPLAPTHGEMPGEFVPLGYLTWVRTWIDDQRYINPVIWSLNDTAIDVDELPASAFDSPKERERVAELFDKYEAPMYDDNGELKQPEQDQNGSEADAKKPEPEMTQAISDAFGEIAKERIARDPLRYYLWLPLKRACALWFDTHSDYYLFTGELFPLEDLDHTVYQHVWLPLFTALVWVFTLLGLLGAVILLWSRDVQARHWVMLAGLMIFLRLAYFSTMENPEPRYTVEFFPLLAVLGGIAIARFKRPDEAATASEIGSEMTDQRL